MNPDSQTGPAPQPEPRLSFKVFGVGTAGVNTLRHLLSRDLDPSRGVAIDSDASTLSSSSAGEKVYLDTQLSRGDPERARATAEEQMPKLKALCAGVRTVLIVAGLGGGVGTGASAVLAAAAKASGALTLAFVVLPFECEGTLRTDLARIGLDRLRAVADLVICLSSQKAMTLIREDTSLIDTFKTSGQMLGDCLDLACRALTGDTVMGLPFSDLCLLLRQRSGDCTMAVAEASAPNHAVELVERLLAHPVLGGAASLREAEALGVCVAGGRSLTMVDVNRAMEQVQRECQGLPVMMGVTVSAPLADRLVVALLVARPLAPVAETPDVASAPEATGEAPQSAPKPDMGIQLLGRSTPRPHSRLVPPPPTLPPEKLQQLRARQTGRGRQALPKMRQSQLPLEIVSKGRFDKSEPTIHKGEDLDMPTYIRRGVSLN